VSLRSVLLALLTLVLTALLVVYAFWQVDLAALAGLLAGGDYRALLPFELLLVAYFILTALRWRLILRPLGRFTLRHVVPPMMIGFGGNNLLPAHLGELVRSIVFALRQDCSRTAVLTTVVLERLLDVFAILMLYTGAAMTLHEFPPSIRAGFWASAVVLGGAALGILAFLRFPHAFVRLWERLSTSLPAKLRALGSRMLLGAEAGLSGLRSPWAVAEMVLHSLLKWLGAAGMVWLSLWAYGEVVHPALAVFVLAVAAIAVTLPSVPGFFGVMQAAFVFALVPFGVSREVALASSVFYLLGQWVPVTVTGVAFFVATGIGLRRMRAEVEQS